MQDSKQRTAQDIIDEEKKNEGQKTPELPPEFYMSLLNLPACKSLGYCDDCGRCER